VRRRKGQQREMAGTFDGPRKHPLVLGARTGTPPRRDGAAARHELLEQADVLVVHAIGLICAKLAYAPAPTAATAATARTIVRTTTTAGAIVTTLSAITSLTSVFV